LSQYATNASEDLMIMYINNDTSVE